MITGIVLKGSEPQVQVRVIGPRGEEELSALVDTGFTRHLTLSRSAIKSLGLQLRGARKATLADGQIVKLRLFHALAVWEGQTLAVQVAESDSDPLIGTALLRGCRMVAEFVDGGAVVICKIAWGRRRMQPKSNRPARRGRTAESHLTPRPYQEARSQGRTPAR